MSWDFWNDDKEESTPPYPYLPGADPDPEVRAARLNKAKEQFQWDHEYLAPIPMLYVKEDGHPDSWEAVAALLGDLDVPIKFPEGYVTGRAAATADVIVQSLRTLEQDRETTFDDMSDYLMLLKSLPIPKVISSVPDDASFAWMRLAGVNPMVIERLTEWPSKLNVTDDQVRENLGGRTLNQALKDGDLYVCDYEILETPEPLPRGNTLGVTKSLPVPIALFAVNKGGSATRGVPLPIAIQLGQDGAKSLVLTPDDGVAWSVAKRMVQIADFNYHEMITHLCRTHFLEEGFLVAAARTLDVNHPLAILLAPHSAGTLANNFEGRLLLVNPGGPVDQLQGGTLAGSLDLVRRGYESFDFSMLNFPEALKARGVDASSSITRYPYRDDGMLLWDAIKAYVGEYVNLYYDSDDAVVADPELQAWIAELTSKEGAHVPGMSSKMVTRAELAHLMTAIIFLAGPQHSAVNFAQYDFMAYVPTMSGAAWQPIPTSKEQMMGRYLLDSLPPPANAAVQTRIIYTLTAYHYDQLGDYGPKLADAAARTIVARFAEDLKEVDNQILHREAEGRAPWKYDYMRPKNVLNATNI